VSPGGHASVEAVVDCKGDFQSALPWNQPLGRFVELVVPVGVNDWKPPWPPWLPNPGGVPAKPPGVPKPFPAASAADKPNGSDKPTVAQMMRIVLLITRPPFAESAPDHGDSEIRRNSEWQSIRPQPTARFLRSVAGWSHPAEAWPPRLNVAPWVASIRELAKRTHSQKLNECNSQGLGCADCGTLLAAFRLPSRLPPAKPRRPGPS
jgi:hypothetical protein